MCLEISNAYKISSKNFELRFHTCDGVKGILQVEQNCFLNLLKKFHLFAGKIILNNILNKYFNLN